MLAQDEHLLLLLLPMGQDVAHNLGAGTRECICSQELLGVESTVLWDKLPEAGVGAPLAVLREDEGTEIGPLDEELMWSGQLLETLE